jgi:hypothetical protein
VIGRPTRRLRHDTVEPKITQVNRIHECVDHADGVISVDPVIQALRKQRRLVAVTPCNKASHPIPPLQSSKNRTTSRVFTQVRRETGKE